jgi:hypothetical protein
MVTITPNVFGRAIRSVHRRKEMENMKKSAAVIFVLLLFVPSLFADPLTWVFTGTTGAGSQFNGNPIVGRSFELQIFLDTNQVGMTQAGLADVFFRGTHPGEIVIQGLGIEPMDAFTNVGYFLGSPNQVTGVELNQPAFNQVLFSSAISSDFLHLTPISPVTPDPLFNGLSMLTGPNGLVVSGTVDTFSAAVVSSPENSTATMLICAFIAVGALRLARWLAWSAH